MTAAEELTRIGEHRMLDGMTSPAGPDVLQLRTDVDALRWLQAEFGARGLSGFLRSRDRLVYTSRVDEDGYVPPLHEGDDNGPATVRAVTPDSVIARIAMNYLVFKEKNIGGSGTVVRTECLFPAGPARLALELVDEMPNLRRLGGVTHTPMVRRDGSVLDVPGYDEQSRFLYLPEPGLYVPPVPASPSSDLVGKAVALLRGMVGEFEWAGEHDEAAFLGLLLTPLLRELCPPPYKLGGIMAHQRGSGKSLLASIIRIVHGGVFRSELPHDDAEMDKALVSILSQTTAPVVIFDNVSGTFRSSRFDGLLTSDTYSGRILGSTNHVDLANDRLWLITGNNLALGGDLDRRTLLVTIDPMTPKPELRTGFALDLTAWVPANRGHILHALLILVRAWMVAGSPTQKRSSDSYAHWSAVVRGILQVAGVPGEFDHPSCAPEQSSTDPEGWGGFLAAAREVFGDQAWTAKELLAKVHDGREHNTTWPNDHGYGAEHPIPLDVLPGDLADKFSRGGAGATSRGLGMWLANRNRRFAGELAGVFAWKDRDSTKHWRVLSADEMRTQGSGAA